MWNFSICPVRCVQTCRAQKLFVSHLKSVQFLSNYVALGQTYTSGIAVEDLIYFMNSAYVVNYKNHPRIKILYIHKPFLKYT